MVAGGSPKRPATAKRSAGSSSVRKPVPPPSGRPSNSGRKYSNQNRLSSSTLGGGGSVNLNRVPNRSPRGSISVPNGLSSPILLPIGDGVISHNVKHQEEDFISGRRCVLMKPWPGCASHSDGDGEKEHTKPPFILQYRDVTKRVMEGGAAGEWRTAPNAIPVFASENARQRQSAPSAVLISPLDQNAKVAEFRFYNSRPAEKERRGVEDSGAAWASDIVGPVFTYLDAPAPPTAKVVLFGDLVPAGVEVNFRLPDAFDNVSAELVPRYAQARYRVLTEGQSGIETKKGAINNTPMGEWLPTAPFMHAGDVTIPTQCSGAHAKSEHTENPPPDPLMYSHIFREIPFGAKCQFQVRVGTGMRWSPWSKVVPKNGLEVG